MTTQTKKRAQCSSCGADFEYDWKELAKHISSKKDKYHRRSKKWAANFLCRTRQLNTIKDKPIRAQLTEQEKENKKAMYREVSGDVDPVDTVCPHCKRRGKSYLPIEFTQGEYVWRSNGIIVFMCNACRG